MPTDPHHAMLNWARWAESGDHHELEAKISSLWRFWLPSKHRDDGWGDPGPAEAMSDPVDAHDAERTDRALRRVAWQHYHTLRQWYYRHHRQPASDIDAALRALGDVLEGRNPPWVVDKRENGVDYRGQDSFALKTEK